MSKGSRLPKIARRRSTVHGHGVFAVEAIAKNTRVIDYAGELIRNDGDCEAREERYLAEGCIVDKTIWIRAARAIRRGEELTYDYSIIGGRTIPCRCRPGCPNKI